MGAIMRLDKFLAESGMGSRSQVKKILKQGLVTVNEETITGAERKIDVETDCVRYNGRKIVYEKYVYYMLNKPAGVVSATRDNNEKTVLDCLKQGLGAAPGQDLFPAGRLDKDTEGLMLITNDGGLAHSLLSPRKHVDKCYYARVDGRIGEEECRLFENGIVLKDGTKCLPAHLTVLESGCESDVQVIIQEGKFHQVKRMFLAVGREVLYLKRLRIGSLKLDETLDAGEFRLLTPEEIAALKQENKTDRMKED
ncbi:pseudouridine synthase [Anaerolentibacter hominis]|uniref:pseudouridine synthase n=1 Tax=Anaerolentibacter hominis TaxID=3079009 RepID=UPI0031B85F09